MADRIETPGDRLRNILKQSAPPTKVEALTTIVRHAELQERAAQSDEIIHPLLKLPRQRFETISVSSLKPQVIRKPAPNSEGAMLDLIRNLGKLFERHENPPLAIDLSGIPSRDKKTLGILHAFDSAVKEGTQVLRTGVLADMVLGVTHAVLDARPPRSEAKPQSIRGLRSVRQGDNSLKWMEESEVRKHDPRPAYPTTLAVAASLDDHGGHKTSNGDGFSTTEVMGSGISMSIGTTSSGNK